MARSLVAVLAFLMGCAPQAERVYYPVVRDAWELFPSALDYTEVAESPAVPAGLLRGVVVDAVSGDPLTAMIEVLGTERRTISDASGQFEIRAAASEVLRIVSIGFEDTRIGLEPVRDRGHGWGARIALRARPAQICSTPVEPGSLFIVDVADALTGTAPTRATLTIRSDGSEESHSAGQDTGFLQLRAGEVRFGTFLVEVSSDGYSTWRQSVAIQSACGDPVPVFLKVWLIPTSAIGT